MAGGLDWMVFKALFQSKVLSIFFFSLFEPPEQNTAFKYLKIIITIYHTFSLREKVWHFQSQTFSSELF